MPITIKKILSFFGLPCNMHGSLENLYHTHTKNGFKLYVHVLVNVNVNERLDFFLKRMCFSVYLSVCY